MSKEQERKIEQKVNQITAQEEIEKLVNPPVTEEAPIILTPKEQYKAKKEEERLEYREYKEKKHEAKLKDEEDYLKACANKVNAKARKVAKHRHLKNFGWWFFGFWSFLLTIVIAVGCVFAFIPIKNFFGSSSEDYVSEKVGNYTGLDFVQNMDTIKGEDIPAIELIFSILLEDYELNKYVSVDVDSLNKATLLSSEFSDALINGVKIIASLKSIGVDEDLGEIGNTPAFTSFEPVPEDRLLNPLDEGFNEKLYYYKNEDGEFVRAFDDDGNRIAESEGKELYYPALSEVMLLDLPAVLMDRFETMKAKELLDCFGMDDDNTFSKIVGDMLVGDLKDFDIKTVQMSVVFDVPSDNPKLRNSLIDMTADAVIDRLSKEAYFNDPNNADKTEEDWDMLSEEDRKVYVDSAKETYNESDKYEIINIGDLTEAQMDAVKLESVMGSDNEKMFKILMDMSGKDKSELTVGDMANADVNQIKITSVMDETGTNAQLYMVLEDMTHKNVIDDMACELYLADPVNEGKTEADWNALTEAGKNPYVASAKELYDKLPCEKYIRENEGKTEADWNALSKAEQEPYITSAKHEIIRVCHLGNGDVSHIKLLSVLPMHDDRRNEKLYNVLRDLSYDKVIEQYIFDNYGVLQDQWKGKDEDAIIGTTGKTKRELRAEAQGEYAMITDVDKKNALITVASLDGASISGIKLQTVMDHSDNKILDKLLKDPTVTVGNMSEKVDDLHIADIYGDKVFTNDLSKAVIFADGKVARYSYDEATKTYTKIDIWDLNANGDMPNDATKYYISSDASIWLFMLYDTVDINGSADGGIYDGEGFAEKYVSNGKQLSEIDGSISEMNEKINNATVRQLVVAGILSNDKNYHTIDIEHSIDINKYPLTLSSVIS